MEADCLEGDRSYGLLRWPARPRLRFAAFAAAAIGARIGARIAGTAGRASCVSVAIKARAAAAIQRPPREPAAPGAANLVGSFRFRFRRADWPAARSPSLRNHPLRVRASRTAARCVVRHRVGACRARRLAAGAPKRATLCSVSFSSRLTWGGCRSSRRTADARRTAKCRPALRTCLHIGSRRS